MADSIERYFFGKDKTPEPIVVLNSVLNAPSMVISIIGNILVLVAISRTPSIRSPSKILLCSLALSDLLVGVVVQPLYLAAFLKRNHSVLNASRTMSFIASGASLFTMTAIAVDRFLALHYHMRYAALMTTSRAKYSLVALWTAAALLSSSGFLNRNVYESTVAVAISVSLFISTICYIRIYTIARRHQNQIHLQQQAVERVNIQRSKKGAKNSFIYYAVMILCYLPLFVNMSLPPELLGLEWILADTLVFFNSSINPFLYCWRLRELRTAVIQTTETCFCKSTEQN